MDEIKRIINEDGSFLYGFPDKGYLKADETFVNASGITLTAKEAYAYEQCWLPKAYIPIHHRKEETMDKTPKDIVQALYKAASVPGFSGVIGISKKGEIKTIPIIVESCTKNEDEELTQPTTDPENEFIKTTDWQTIPPTLKMDKFGNVTDLEGNIMECPGKFTDEVNSVEPGLSSKDFERGGEAETNNYDLNPKLIDIFNAAKMTQTEEDETDSEICKYFKVTVKPTEDEREKIIIDTADCFINDFDTLHSFKRKLESEMNRGEVKIPRISLTLGKINGVITSMKNFLDDMSYTYESHEYRHSEEEF